MLYIHIYVVVGTWRTGLLHDCQSSWLAAMVEPLGPLSVKINHSPHATRGDQLYLFMYIYIYVCVGLNGQNCEHCSIVSQLWGAWLSLTVHIKIFRKRKRGGKGL